MITQAEWDRARKYMIRFCVGGSTAHAIWKSRSYVSPQTGKMCWMNPSWTTEHTQARIYDVATGLRNSTTKIGPREMRVVGHIAVDVDVHDDPPIAEVERWVTEDPELRANIVWRIRDGEHRPSGRLYNKKALSWRAEKIRPILDRARELGLPIDMVTTTERGARLVILLDAPEDGHEAAEIAKRMERVLYVEGAASVEVFPKREGDYVRHCSLPLMGKARAVKDDAETNVGLARAPDVDRLLSIPGHRMADIDAIVWGHASKLGPEKPRTARDPGRADGQTYGSEFAEELEDLLSNGMDRGGSYDAVRKVCAGIRYMIRGRERAERAVSAWIDCPIHRASHCGSERGKRQLKSVMRAQMRYFDRGMEVGRCYEGGMRSNTIAGIVERLLGESSNVVGHDDTDRGEQGSSRVRYDDPFRGIVFEPEKDPVFAAELEAVFGRQRTVREERLTRSTFAP